MRSKSRRILLPVLLIIGLALFDFDLLNTDTIRIRVLTFLIAVFNLVFLVGLFSGRYRRRGGTLNKYILLVIWVALLSAVNLFDKPNNYILDFITSSTLLILNGAMALMLSGLVLSITDITRVFRIWLYLAIPISLYGIYQALATVLPLPLPTIHPLMGYGTSCLGNYCRPSSIFSEASHLGAFLLPPIILQGVFIAQRIDTEYLFSSRRNNILSLLITSTGFLLAYSEAAYLALIASTMVFMTFAKVPNRIRKRLIKAGLFIVTIFVILLAFLEFYGSDFTEGFVARTQYALQMFNPFTPPPGEKSPIVVSSASGRYSGSIRSVHIWLDHPLLGVGLNNSENYFDKYRITGRQLPSVPGVGWAVILSDLGIMGFLSVIVLYGAILKKLRQHTGTVGSQPLYSLILSLYIIIWADLILRFAAGDLVDPRKWVTLGLALLVAHSADNAN